MKLTWQLLIIATLSLSFIACKSDKGAKADTSEAGTVNEEVGKNYSVDAETSMISWEGSKIAGKHMGTIKVQEGSVSVKEGKITGGNFTIDMNSINVTDLEGDKKAYLESHLKGSADDNADDFFNVNKYPTAKFEITKVSNLTNDPEASHLVYGNLSLKDVTKQVGFKAQIAISESNITVNAPQFKIDRTEWGIKYGSGKFFDDLKDKAIDDEMGITIDLKAKV